MIFCLLLQNLSVVLACMCHIEYYLLTVRSHFLDIPPSFCVLWCRGGCSLWTLSALQWFVVLPALLFYPTYMPELNLWRGGRRHLGWEKKPLKDPRMAESPNLPLGAITVLLYSAAFPLLFLFFFCWCCTLGQRDTVLMLTSSIKDSSVVKVKKRNRKRKDLITPLIYNVTSSWVWL